LGNYTCTAQNNFGQTESSIAVRGMIKLCIQ
jgi:hypothetical protein